MIKKMVSVVLAAAMMFFMLPTTSFADSYGDYEYTNNGDGTCTITGYTGSGGNVEIEQNLNGLTVKNIGDFSFNNKSLISVTIPGTVESIGNNAFGGNALTSISIPDSVTSIGNGAFGSNNLQTVTIGSGVTSIGSAAFNNNQITSVTGGGTSDGIIFARRDDASVDDTTIVSYGGTSDTVDFIPNSVKNIGHWAFIYSGLISVTIPTGIESIDVQAFHGNALTTVTIPDSVTSLGSFAFSSNSLESVTLPNNITTIESGMFQHNSITSVTIPSSVESIGDNAFNDNSLTVLTVPDSVTRIGSAAFCENSIETLTLGSSVTIIETFAFSANSLTSVTIPDSVESIGYQAFYNNSLQSVTLGTGLKDIGEMTFNNNQITNVTGGGTSDGIIFGRHEDCSIDDSVIASYGGASKVIDFIPESVIEIGKEAFYSSSLTSVTIPGNVSRFGDYAFSNNSLASISLPNSVTYIGLQAFSDNTFTTFELPTPTAPTFQNWKCGSSTYNAGDTVSSASNDPYIAQFQIPDDIIYPLVNSASVLTTSIQKPDFITVSLDVTEEGSGITMLSVGLYAYNGDEERCISATVNYEEPQLSGTYTVDIEVPNEAFPGIYRIGQIDVTDASGNHRIYYDNLPKAGYSNDGENNYIPTNVNPNIKCIINGDGTAEVIANGDEDITSPLVNSAAILTGSVNKPGTVTVSLDVTEEGSGLTMLKVGLYAYNGDEERSMYATVNYEEPQFSGTYTVDIEVPIEAFPGTYRIGQINAEDVYGNHRLYYDNLPKAGYSNDGENDYIPTNVNPDVKCIINGDGTTEVIAIGDEDITSPLVNNASMLTTSVQKPGTITVSLDVTEEGSGLTMLKVGVYAYNGDEERSMYATVNYEEPQFSGTYTVDIEVPIEAFPGTYRIGQINAEDVSGNHRLYYDNLPKAGYSYDGENNYIPSNVNPNIKCIINGNGTTEVLSAAPGFAQGDGTESNPYGVSTTAQLNEVRNHINSHFILLNDIDLSAATSEGGAFYNDGAGWTPIGLDEEHPFNGSFNGNGHVIKGLYQNLTGGYATYGGLFGYMNSGTIKNLGMIDSDINVSGCDHAFVGSLVGRINGGVIRNCYTTGSVSSTTTTSSDTGGIVGVLEDSSEMYDCFNTARVDSNCPTDSDSVGGLVGSTYLGTIENCYNTGKIISDEDAAVGGVLGDGTGHTITNCYYLNHIANGVGNGMDAAIGLTYVQLSAQSSFFGFDFANSWEIVEGVRFPILHNIPFEYVQGVSIDETLSMEENSTIGIVPVFSPSNASNKNVSWESNNESVATVVDGMVSAVALGTATITVTTQDGGYTDTCNVSVEPILVTSINLNSNSDIVEKEGTLQITAEVLPDNAADKSIAWSVVNGTGQATIDDNGLLTAVQGGTVTVKASANDGSGISAEKVINVNHFYGLGTESSPYLIESADDLALLATLVNDGSSFENEYFSQTADIDLSGISNWTPIGLYAFPTINSFKGIYDGKNFNITEMNIDITTTGSVHAGLFAYTQGTIKNVNVLDGNLYVSSDAFIHAGGIAGRIQGASIENCTSSINITIEGTAGSTGRVSVGGIVGYTGTEVLSVKNCINYGDIYAVSNYETFVGGIVGFNDGGRLISNCYNNGNIRGEKNTSSGGIVGFATNFLTYDADIIQCYNTGSVYVDNTTYAGHCGGIAGTASEVDISDCFNIGYIYEENDSHPANVGGIVGRDINSCNIKNSYNIGQISGDGVLGGIAGTISSSSISNCYYADTCSNGIGNGSGTTYQKTLEELKQQATYNGFNFATMWDIVEATRFPILQNTPFEYVQSVSIDETLSMEENDTFEIIPIFTPTDASNKNLSWESDNESVATVEGGIITAVAQGSATITVTTQDLEYTDTCNITVTKSVTGVSLDKETDSVDVGDTTTLVASVSPSDATNTDVTWSSSNTSIATVADGVVTGVSEGTATITVTTQDGGYTDTCIITVTKPVTGVSLDKETDSVDVGDTTTLVATVNPSDATNTDVTWSSSNNSVATVTDGVVTGVSKGTATITVTTQDSGYTDTCIITVTKPVTGVSLDKETDSVDVGDTTTLVAAVNPSDATNTDVTWSSSNTSIATVADGVVTGVSEGTATITVTTVDGEYTDTCLVSVLLVTGFAQGDGTESNPYGISTPKHLNAVRNYPNAHFIMLNDINLSAATSEGGAYWNGGAGWEPIGDSETPFSGVFDGDGYKILNINITGLEYVRSGLFGYVNTGIIKNVNMEGGAIDVDDLNNKDVGSVVGSISNGTIINCSSSTSIIHASSSNLDYGIGGIAGRASRTTISNCVNTGSLSLNGGVPRSGGIVGYVYGFSEETEIINCVNYGDISTEHWAVRHIGGIVGYSEARITIRSCSNYGDISTGKFYQMQIGGIVGTCATNTDVSILQCSNAGDISISLPDGVCAGGIAGRIDGGNILECYNSGDITVAHLNDTYVGGIVGKDYYTNSILSLNDCFNLGNVICSPKNSAAYMGGIIGYGDSTIETYTNCYNVGEISDNTDYGGGIAGWATVGAAAFNNCYYAYTCDKGIGYGEGAVTSKTMTELKQQASFSGFDFTNIWEIVEGQRFPILQNVPFEYVTGVSLEETLSLEVGDRQMLTPIFTPADAMNKNVNWSSDDESVAIVVDGEVTCVSGGSATITVETEDGGFTDTCTVTVMQSVTGVSLDKSTTIVAVDGTDTLTATVSPAGATNKNVTWSSDDESVATVSDGVVTGVSEGSTAITVTTEDGAFTDTCDVTVILPVTGVFLNKTNIEMSINDTEKLTATVSPSDASNTDVTWASENESVATVENGTVTAVGAGTAVITVTTEDGEFTDTCTITVTQPVTGVLLNKSTVNLLVTEKETLTATVTPSDAFNKNVAWSSSNTGVATVSNGVVTAKSEGTTTITVTTEDGNYKDTCTVNVSIPTVRYQTHVQNVGWQGWKYNGEAAGTSGRSLRLEGMYIEIEDIDNAIEYRTHVQNIGWQDWVSDGEMTGTSGRSLRLEAIDIRLKGKMAEIYDIYYRVHAQNFGWMDWAKNGQSAGTAGYAYRLEAIEIVMVEKGGAAPGPTTMPFKDKNGTTPVTPPVNPPVNPPVKPPSTDDSVRYQTHVQNVGWQGWKYNGDSAGTSGKSLRLEGMYIEIIGQDNAIEYRTHVQNIGWQDWVSDGEMTGTSGRSLRLEAIDIRLMGEMADVYDVYYRVHAQNVGWMDWAKNGRSAGTAGFSYRLEAIQIVLVEKGGAAPGETSRPFISAYTH